MGDISRKMRAAELLRRTESHIAKGLTSARDLAAAFRISVKTAEKLLERAFERIEKRHAENVDRNLAIRVEQMDSIARMAIHSFELSQEPDEPDEDDPRPPKKRPGDPNFLRLAKDSFMEGAKLQGCYPSKTAAKIGSSMTTEMLGPDGQRIVQQIWTEVPTDDLVAAMVQMKSATDKLRAATKAQEEETQKIEHAVEIVPEEPEEEEDE